MEPGGMYDSGFEAYKTVTPDEYRMVLRTGLVILDANALLHLYRYHPGTRRDLVEVLVAIKEQLWIPHQVMHEFWQGRPGVIDGRSREIDEVINGLQVDGLRLGEGVRKWANRIGLPPTERERILNRIESTIKYTTDRVRTLSSADAAEDYNDTDRDPVLAALRPILEGSVGRPLSPDVARDARKEALQRITDKRAPGWRDATKKENKEGDYFVWYQSLQEAKRRGLDVLFVTDDTKPDWWRIERGETKGPLPELVHEMREVASVRLFMTRPETLLLHAKDVLGKDVSSDSIRDVQRVSSQVDIEWHKESTQHRTAVYMYRVMAVIIDLGYLVTVADEVIDQGYDLIIRRPGDDRVVLGGLKFRSELISLREAYELAGMASRSPSPVLLIANVGLTVSAEDIVQESEGILAVKWRDESDSPQLAAALEQIFHRPATNAT